MDTHITDVTKPTAEDTTDRWHSLTTIEIEGRELPPGRLQMATCWRVGDVFVRGIRGRYRREPTVEIVGRLAELQPLIDSMGMELEPDPALSPADRLEFIENVLDFEVSCPCGCTSHLGTLAGTM